MNTLPPRGSRGRAAIYARVSTDNQDTGLSTATQVEHSRRHGEMLGFTIGDEDIYTDEGISGMTDDRAGFRAMMLKALSSEKPWTGIIVTDIGRLSRSSGGYINYEEILAEENIELIAPMDPEGNPQVKINTNRRMKAVMNEGQVVDSALKTRNSQMFAVEMGFYIGWTRPFGLRKVTVMWRKAEHIKLEPHPEEWPHLLHMIEMGKTNYSLRQIIEYADATGLKHPAGEIVKVRNGKVTRRGNGRFTGDNLSYLLTKSKAVLGWTARGGEGSGTKILHKSEEVICKNAHPAAMKENERNRIIRNLASRNPEVKSPQAQRSPNPMSTLLVCGMCGATMQLHTANGIQRLKCANSREYKKDHPRWCPNPSVRLDMLLEKTIDALLGHILTEKVLRKLTRTVAKVNKDFVEAQQERQKQINKRIEELGKEIGNLIAAIATYGPQNSTWGSEIDWRQKERELLQRELQSIDQELEQKLVFLNAPERIVENALTLRNNLESEDLHSVGQMLQSLINKGSILNRTVTLYYAVPLPKDGTEHPILSEKIELSKKSCRSVGNAGIDPRMPSTSRSIHGFPRRRGIDRPPRGGRTCCPWFPRRRGDRPHALVGVYELHMVPPQARG